MSLSFVIGLFAAFSTGILLCEQAVPYRKRLFYSLAAAGFLCCGLACFVSELYVLCQILLVVAGVLSVLFGAVSRFAADKRKMYGTVLNDSIADGKALVYAAGCVWLVPNRDGTKRKGDTVKMNGKEWVLYHGE